MQTKQLLSSGSGNDVALPYSTSTRLHLHVAARFGTSASVRSRILMRTIFSIYTLLYAGVSTACAVLKMEVQPACYA